MTMHVYNAWLPPPLAELTTLEAQAFSLAVGRLQQDWQPRTPSSAHATLKWISVFDNFLKAKSELAIPDIEAFVKLILNVFLNSDSNFYVQARWGTVFTEFLKKYAKRLDLNLDWRPFYALMMSSSSKRTDAFEGMGVKQSQVLSLSKIIRKCRRFFPKESATEIWMEFRPMLDDLSHNASLASVGFISLLLPTNGEVDSEFFTSEWFSECLALWDGVPNCSYWDLQWGSLLGRCIKNHRSMPNLDLERFVAPLFAHGLRSFEVPIGKTTTAYPYRRESTKEVMRTFSLESSSLPREIAKSIVYMLKPNSSAQRHLECLIELLEQYYHPSNGGSWTLSLERFLRSLVAFFMKRLAKEQRKSLMLSETLDTGYMLTGKERQAFVRSVMRLIERGQFSKNGGLAKTAAMASASLAYVEPMLVLPLSITRLYTALDTITATHQLEAALKIVALSSRALLLASTRESSSSLSSEESFTTADWTAANFSVDFLTSCKDVLEFAITQSLSGLDPNDPPKTLATLQLFCSIFSNLGTLGCETDTILSIDWSQWLDEFLSRLFNLLLHLEPSNHSVENVENNGLHLSSKSFLVKKGSFYLSTLELLFARLEKPLLDQALKRIAKFVHNHTLPGAVAEIGLLCSAIVYASPSQAISCLMKPLMSSVISHLGDSLPRGFSGNANSNATFDAMLTFSRALEASIIYQLDLLSLGLLYGGESMVECRDMLKNVISASIGAPSTPVKEAGSRLLSSILACAVLYYPLDQYKLQANKSCLQGVEDWVSTKDDNTLDGLRKSGPFWHLPSPKEVGFAKELLDMHLKGALAELKQISQCENSTSAGNSAQEREHLRALLLRIEASLRGIRSCLHDFIDPRSNDLQPCFIAGAAGVAVGSPGLRQEAANTLHLACEYLLAKKADDISLLLLLVRSIAMVGNCGSIEYLEWRHAKSSFHSESKSLVEPSTNYITNTHAKGHRRPNWMIVEMVLLHNTWRASQSHYNQNRIEPDGISSIPQHIMLLTYDLLNLSMNNYEAVRMIAATSLNELFKQFPACINGSMPSLFKGLQDNSATEHAAIGACTVLESRVISRHFTQDFFAFSCFLLAILNSAHHESVKVQNAISKVFLMFVMRFGGLPVTDRPNSEGSAKELHTDLTIKILSFCSRADAMHWRYNLMAEGMLMLLSTHGVGSGPCRDPVLLERVAGHFLLNLKSELPPLRALSVVALLFLLRRSPAEENPEAKENGATESTMVSTLEGENFGSIVLNNVSVDHHFQDGQTRLSEGGFGRSFAQFSGNPTFWMPVSLRDWPRTRTWDSTMKGDAFSSKFAKLFKRLVREFGHIALDVFRGPLEEAANALDERGKQCAAAEAIAGFLHLDLECVVKAWDGWLQELLKKFLDQSSVESIPEWAACVRFVVTGKGRLGRRPPLMRSQLLKLLLQPVHTSASSNALVKHFTYLLAAVNEVFLSPELPDEINYQEGLLRHATTFLQNPAPQVREVVGAIICIVSTNLELMSVVYGTPANSVVNLEDWKTTLICQAKMASVKCQTDEAQHLVEPSKSSVLSDNDVSITSAKGVQDAVRLMETVLHIVITALKSGRLLALMDIIVELLQPILSLQETFHKELSFLAKVALHLLKFQVFPTGHVQKALEAVLLVANDANWHKRTEALKFLQSFIYRHTYLLSKDSFVRIWIEVEKLLDDNQVEVRELATVTLTGMLKVADDELSSKFRKNQLDTALAFFNAFKSKRKKPAAGSASSPVAVHSIVLGLAACVLSVPYDMPKWLPETITMLARFSQQDSSAVRATVQKTVAEFRRTHADTWTIHKSMFTEEELEILMETSSPASYFA